MKIVPQPAFTLTNPELYRTTLFWPFENWGGPELPWQTYAETFSDISKGSDSLSIGDIFPWNWHLAEYLLYEFGYKGLAERGCCFGMCLEAHYARNSMTPFVEPIYNNPLNTFQNDNGTLVPTAAQNATVSQEIYIKHGYQIGAPATLWLLNMWKSGGLNDPVRAFRESRDAYAHGDWPLLTLSNGGALSGDGHAVVPFSWDPPTDADASGLRG
jgi:hypothetical protein